MDVMNEPGNATLSEFIELNLERILQRWEQFARSIPLARTLDTVALRDHAIGILREIASDLTAAQTSFQQAEKSKGHALQSKNDTQAELHGAGRVDIGFTVNDAISEFRALRASILHLWGEAKAEQSAIAVEELIRFNEAVDQALADSMKRFALQKDDYTRRFDKLLSSSPDLHFIIGADGRFIYVNEALSEQLVLPQDHIVGRHLRDFFPTLASRIITDFQKVIDTCQSLSAEVHVPAVDGTNVTYRYALLPVLNCEGQVDSVTGTARNISELMLSEEKVHRNAYYDSLTQLPNRALLHDRLEQNLKHAERTQNPLALLFIDLDGFKGVNDRSGHAVGDQLLKESARRISTCVRRDDTVARIGGDEFTVLLTEIHDIFHIEIVAQAILDELAKPFTIGEISYLISGSIGITMCPQDAHTPDELLRNADQAMYVAKQAGRNRFSFFTAEMRDSAWARLKIIDELRLAVGSNQLEVYYQPIVHLASGAIAKAEALVRWHHPQGRMILPNTFIGLAEQTGLIGEIDSWVLGEAVEYAHKCSALLGRPFQISVNKSPVEFMSVGMVKGLHRDISTLGLARNQIAVEITEGVLLNDSEAIRERLAMLKKAGVQFTIDDFGIGYSSMSYLKKFQVDFLKIDQSFVKDIIQSADNRVFAETIIVMAHKLGLQVIAEGVETIEQRDWLNAMQCDYAQGFLFAEAAPIQHFTEMLEAGLR